MSVELKAHRELAGIPAPKLKETMPAPPLVATNAFPSLTNDHLNEQQGNLVLQQKAQEETKTRAQRKNAKRRAARHRRAGFKAQEVVVAGSSSVPIAGVFGK